MHCSFFNDLDKRVLLTSRMLQVTFGLVRRMRAFFAPVRSDDVLEVIAERLGNAKATGLNQVNSIRVKTAAPAGPAGGVCREQANASVSHQQTLIARSMPSVPPPSILKHGQAVYPVRSMMHPARPVPSGSSVVCYQHRPRRTRGTLSAAMNAMAENLKWRNGTSH